MNSLKNVSVIGLTGQSGAGKTTVCSIFEKNGFSIINADTISREVTKKGSPCLDNIADVFPECIDSKTGELDRSKMGEVVFNDKDLLKVFSSIIYPYITTKVLSEIRNFDSQGKKLILLDAPTLFESRVDDFCNYNVCVIADETIRFNRIIKRDNISQEMIMNRFNSQNDDKFYIDRSDMVIYNNDDIEELNSNAEECVKRIKEMFNA